VGKDYRGHDDNDDDDDDDDDDDNRGFVSLPTTQGRGGERTPLTLSLQSVE